MTKPVLVESLEARLIRVVAERDAYRAALDEIEELAVKVLEDADTARLKRMTQQ